MDDLEKRIKEALRSNLDPVHSRGVLGTELRRRASRRRTLTTLGGAGALALVAVIAFVATVALMTRPASDVATNAGQSSGATDTPSHAPLSEEITIASGEHKGDSWRWSGYMAKGYGDAGPALCTTWTISSSDLPADTVCTVDITDGLPKGEAIASDTGSSPFFGAIAKDVTRVTLEVEGGQPMEAETFDSPPSWDLNLDFFVGFAPESADSVTLIAENADGTVVDRERHSELPVLVVSKEGSGVVTGYSTEELRCDGEGCQEPRKWIDCGSECRTEVEDTELRLEATAGEGSTFTGWSGACSGRETCTLMIDADTSVSARFEPSN